MDAAALVLAGGRSSRMGESKAHLTWRGGTLLRQVTSVVAGAVGGPVIVVRAPGQTLPGLPPDIEVAEDAVEGLGPLQGLAAGLQAVGQRAEVAFVAATDLPFLSGAVVRALLAAMDQDRSEPEAVVPLVGGHLQPLVAVYRVGLAARASQLLESGHRSAMSLLDVSRVRSLDESALLHDPGVARDDPNLASFRDVNDRQGYLSALGDQP